MRKIPYRKVWVIVWRWTVLSGHMVVVALAENGRVVVDFLGLVEDESYDIQVIDDLTAYAHLLNNVAGHQAIKGAPIDGIAAWERARSGFELATKVQPRLGRAWNNLGIAYARLGLFAQSRVCLRPGRPRAFCPVMLRRLENR